MAAQQELVAPSDGRWREAMDLVPHDVYHLPEYAGLPDLSAVTTPLAFRYAEGDDVLLLPLLLRRVPDSAYCDAVTPYGYPGPVGSTDDAGFWDRACRGLLTCLREAEIVSCFIRLHPLITTPAAVLARFGELPRRGETVSIDLSLSDEHAWASMRQNHRRNISATRRLERRLVLDEWGRLDEFVDMYYETMRRVGARQEYFFGPEYFGQLRTALGQHVHLAFVAAGGELTAGGLFFECAEIVQYHLGATRSEWLREQPAKFMFDEVRRWARGRGNKALHLGGGASGDPEDPVLHFKAGFSRSRHPFHTWQLVVDSAAYDALAPVGASGPDDYFPAYRRPCGAQPAKARA